MATPKIWETEQRVVSNQGTVQLTLQKDFSRNADWGTFYANAINRTNGINIAFRGVCSPFINIQVHATDTRKLNLKPFLQSRSGRDLPIHDTLDAMRTNLESQCENIQVIRMRFAPSHHTQEDYNYVGTLTKSSGWQLQDGIVATGFDEHHQFDIAVRDFFSVAGVRYSGGCSTQPVLTVQPWYQNNSERALSKKPDITNVTMVAKDAAISYAKECPQAQSIQFIVNPIPEDYECQEPGDCFLLAAMGNGEWTVDTNQFKPKQYYSPINKFADFVEVLAAGEHRILDDYRNFFAFYFESFIGIYSDHCRSYIQNPVGREIQPVERRYDSSGFLISEENAGPKREIWVEQRYANAFDRYFGSWKAWGTVRMLKTMATRNPNKQLGRVWESSTYAMGFFTGNYNSLERLVKNHCNDERIQAAYVNMLNYANNQPPIKGTFTTDKTPYVKPIKNGSSAPIMAKQLAEKAKRAQQQKSPAQEAAEARERQRAEQRRQKIRDEIAQRNAPRNQRPTERQRNPLPSRQQYSDPPQPSPQRPAPIRRSGNGNVDTQALQALVLEQMRRATEVNKEYQLRIRQAKTTEERAALQQEFQQLQRKAAQEYQKLLLEAQQRR